MKGFNEKMCPKCGSEKIKEWNDLTGEERFLVERLPMSAELTLEERKRHRWCVKCWYEFADRRADLA